MEYFPYISVWGLLPHPVVSSTCGDLSGTVGTTGILGWQSPSCNLRLEAALQSAVLLKNDGRQHIFVWMVSPSFWCESLR